MTAMFDDTCNERTPNDCDGAHDPQVLDLAALDSGLPGVTEVRARAYAEAAAVSLDRQGHQSGVTLHVAGVVKQELRVRYRSATDIARKAWSDDQEATEDGACALAFLLVLRLTEFTVIQRSAKGTGIDYWLAHNSDAMFQSAARLEVSGIARGGADVVARRVRSKLRQTQRCCSALPAYVSVTEFGTPTSVLEKR